MHKSDKIHAHTIMMHSVQALYCNWDCHWDCLRILGCIVFMFFRVTGHMAAEPLPHGLFVTQQFGAILARAFSCKFLEELCEVWWWRETTIIGRLLYGLIRCSQLAAGFGEQMAVNYLLWRLHAHLPAHLCQISGRNVHAVSIESHIAVGMIMFCPLFYKY